jgi:hypothetical protein
MHDAAAYIFLSFSYASRTADWRARGGYNGITMRRRFLYAYGGILFLAFSAQSHGFPDAAGLKIINPTLHQSEDGPPVAGTHSYIPGETVFVSFQVAGFRRTEDRHVKLSYEVRAVDQEGVLLAPPAKEQLHTELTLQDRDWMPRIRYTLLIPPLIFAGTYKIQAAVQDELASTGAKLELPIQVRARQVQPSHTLVIRNYRFLRSETDTSPLVTPAYRPGDTLWARFEITGYQYADGNRYKVDYGVAVLSEEGEVLFEQPDAAAEEDKSFYPKRYVLGSLSLSLDPDLRKDNYAIRVQVRDHVGDQTYEQIFPFSVR